MLVILAPPQAQPHAVIPGPQAEPSCRHSGAAAGGTRNPALHPDEHQAGFFLAGHSGAAAGATFMSSFRGRRRRNPESSSSRKTMIDHLPSVIDHASSVIDHLPNVTDHTSSVADHLPSVARHPPSVIDHTLGVTDHLPNVTHHPSSVIHHLPSVTDHTSSVIDHPPSVTDHTSGEIRPNRDRPHQHPTKTNHKKSRIPAASNTHTTQENLPSRYATLSNGTTGGGPDFG